ncbi:MAG: GIY-YIG nuclease family protein [bacterium]
MQPAVYILASKPSGTLYIGVTADLAARVLAHRSKLNDGFARQYKVRRLVHVEYFAEMTAAIEREKCLKRWRRAWKIELIEKDNPRWRDLWWDLV